jgi:protein-S-isoprenylcysteine O-methyltransferase Ste14
MRLSNLTVIILIPAIAGLDFRFNWSILDTNFVFVGLVFGVASTVLLNWAMIANPHFEPTVRIQKERNHKVITSGPYKIVRHPGYLAGILFAISIPLLIGSFFSFFAVGIYVILMILRTCLEDKTLQEELEGYSEYISQVKYRLFPGIWRLFHCARFTSCSSNLLGL